MPPQRRLGRAGRRLHRSWRLGLWLSQRPTSWAAQAEWWGHVSQQRRLQEQAAPAGQVAHCPYPWAPPHIQELGRRQKDTVGWRQDLAREAHSVLGHQDVVGCEVLASQMHLPAGPEAQKQQQEPALRGPQAVPPPRLQRQTAWPLTMKNEHWRQSSPC